MVEKNDEERFIDKMSDAFYDALSDSSGISKESLQGKIAPVDDHIKFEKTEVKGKFNITYDEVLIAAYSIVSPYYIIEPKYLPHASSPVACTSNEQVTHELEFLIKNYIIYYLKKENNK